jgi:hypothetical protein
LNNWAGSLRFPLKTESIVCFNLLILYIINII